jgi:hypothetical protein
MQRDQLRSGNAIKASETWEVAYKDIQVLAKE